MKHYPVLIAKATLTILTLVCLFLPTIASSGQKNPLATGQVAQLNIGPSRVDWYPVVEYDRLVLTVSTPDGTVLRREFEAGANPFFGITDKSGGFLPDGQYTYELVVVPSVDRNTREVLQEARSSGDMTALEELRKAGVLPRERLVQSGSFSIAGSAFVIPRPEQIELAAKTASGISAKPTDGYTPLKNVVNADDLIVRGSLCVGLDCVNNENFGFDTIRLKENNTRIKFEDTSVGSYPSNDWQITANDSTSGGLNKFSVEDVTGVKIPFTIVAGAPTNSIYVGSSGRVGFGTSTPVLDLHAKTGDTPSLRLEQDASGGYTAQTWDLGANESNFFLRDATGGSKLPFRVRPGAPTSSIDVANTGNVGIGTASPGVRLHVVDSAATTARRNVLLLENKGPPTMKFSDTVAPDIWEAGIAAAEGRFRIGHTAGGALILGKEGWGQIRSTSTILFNLEIDGDLTISGTLTQNSNVNSKENISPVDGRILLSRLEQVPVSTWNFKDDGNATRHLGPMAQDFHAAFGLGKDERSISPMDATGVALAAIKELNSVVREKEKRIIELEARIAALEAMVKRDTEAGK
jgi:hypothetical protein